jgi:uncharacterized FlaG/YvyC family protein
MRPDGTFITASLAQVWPVSVGSRGAGAQVADQKVQSPSASGVNETASALEKGAKAAQRPPLVHSHLLIEFDRSAGRYVQKTIDGETQEVRNQFPREAQLAFSRSIGEAANKLIDIEV